MSVVVSIGHTVRKKWRLCSSDSSLRRCDVIILDWAAFLRLARAHVCPQDQALDLLNLEFGFAYELETPWHAVFAEAAAPEGDAAAAAAHPAPGAVLYCCGDSRATRRGP